MNCKSLLIKAQKIKCSFFPYIVGGRVFFRRMTPSGGGGGLGKVGTRNFEQRFTPVHICPRQRHDARVAMAASLSAMLVSAGFVESLTDARTK